MSKKYTTNPEVIEAYSHVIDMKLIMPSIKLVSLTLEGNESSMDKLAYATGRRYFTLEHDWKILLDRIEENEELNGRVTIPSKVKGEKVIFDGASVPAPWLVSLLTLGVLRPMGVMLTASIVHDFAYKFGYLIVNSGEGRRAIAVTRNEADALFKNMLITSTGLKVVGLTAYFFVQIGWLFGVKFNGQRFSGKPPVFSLALFALIIALLVAIILSSWFAPLMLLTFVAYLAFYIGSLKFLSDNNPNNITEEDEEAVTDASEFYDEEDDMEMPDLEEEKEFDDEDIAGDSTEEEKAAST